MKEHDDRVQLVLPKGRKEELQAIAKRHGQSVNAFMISLLYAALEHESSYTDNIESGSDAAKNVHTIPSEVTEA